MSNETTSARKAELELGMEYPDPRETQWMEDMVEMMKASMEKNYQSGKKRRQFHPKMHGLLEAEFRILEALPQELQEGLFSQPATYKAWVRFSNAPTQVGSDKRRSGRGIAIKLLNVPGPRLEEKPDEETAQDFLLTTSPVLSPGNPRNYRAATKALTQGFPWNLLYVLNPGNWRRVYLTIANMGRHTDLFAINYFSGAPLRFGTDGPAVKFSLRPISTTKAERPEEADDNFLRANLGKRLQAGEVKMAFMVQLQEDPHEQPVEDTSREWHTPFHQLAELTFRPQDFDNPKRNELGEKMRFSPWNALVAHRPLGGINRIRKEVYEKLADFRLKE